MEDGPKPQSPKSKEPLEALRQSLQSAFDRPLSGLQQGLESLLDQPSGSPPDPLRDHLHLMIQVCTDLRDRARESLKQATSPEEHAGTSGTEAN